MQKQRQIKQELLAKQEERRILIAKRKQEREALKPSHGAKKAVSKKSKWAEIFDGLKAPTGRKMRNFIPYEEKES